ncbi:hypothetical protein BO86DRAFT_386663 [Aspergillus japonicus CBS 114.51]|uniref:Uncharacterized protein n=1 Tax=Aspergillus japonicus CBS 114.51 TaxID=1448312 RepID=A0A8T8XAN1_ASPJA|nr:hypothetical protein BO86DRAFT_386663 [Aspergillus japonicus CBS 114.51]RAH85131.1 hypothetical protein BO86DRAFT_386663 [Aspergillus japonicus CBS 114.51]
MSGRGLWNQHVDGKWYRFFDAPRAIISPASPATLRVLQLWAADTFDLTPWELAPFPSPLHSDLDVVYTIDKDRGLLTVAQWDSTDGVPSRLTRQVKLANIYDPSVRTLDAVLAEKGNAVKQLRIPRPRLPAIFPAMDWPIEPPTPLNELQFRCFVDFVRLWRFYLDDLSGWSDRSLLRTMAMGVLRIAAWDFEVRFGGDTADVPATFSSLPRWPAPANDIFWFHGFLVTLYSPFESLDQAVHNAQAYLENSQCSTPTVRVLLLSLSHVTLLEVSGPSAECSPTLPLITDSSALHPSPGFRALASLLTSQTSKTPRCAREEWGVNLPTEIFETMVLALPSRDLVSFAQASLRVEKWYYASSSSVPQLGGLCVQSFEFSRPCCGEGYQPTGGSVACSICYTWSHTHCLGLGTLPPSEVFKCASCQQDATCSELGNGGIHRTYLTGRCTTPARCRVAVDGATRLLTLRTSEPAALRPELRGSTSGLTISPGETNYAICFNGVFSGLAYGLDDCDEG